MATTFAPPEEAILPDGTTVAVRPLDALGYQLLQDIESDPDKNGLKVYDLIRTCLPESVSDESINRLTPGECAVIVLIAAGRIRQVQALAEAMEKNGQAPVEAGRPEPEPSSTPSGSSAPASPESSGAV
jgi:N-acetyl-gamma-glutamylphosphate reductase